MSAFLPSAILFDLDDTIIQHGPAERSFLSAAERYRARFGPATPSRLLRAFQEARAWFWGDPQRHRLGRLDPGLARREMAGRMAGSLGLDHQDDIEEMLRDYGLEREKGAALFDGALETLGGLRSLGLRLALVTNGESSAQRKKIQRFALDPYFHHIQIEEEFGHGKPDERVYRHALRCVGAAPADTWVVGDNLDWEVRAPQALGMQGIWVDWAGVGLPEASGVRPFRIIRTIVELLPDVWSSA